MGGRSSKTSVSVSVTVSTFQQKEVSADGIMYLVPSGITWNSPNNVDQTNNTKQCELGRCRLLELGVSCTITYKSLTSESNRVELPVLFCTRCLVLRIKGVSVCGERCNCEAGKGRLCCYKNTLLNMENFTTNCKNGGHACSYCKRHTGSVSRGARNDLEDLYMKLVDLQNLKAQPNGDNGNDNDDEYFTMEERELESLLLLSDDQKSIIHLSNAKNIGEKNGWTLEVIGRLEFSSSLQKSVNYSQTTTKKGFFSSSSSHYSSTSVTSDHLHEKQIFHDKMSVGRSADNSSSLIKHHSNQLISNPTLPLLQYDNNNKSLNNNNLLQNGDDDAALELWDCSRNVFSDVQCSRSRHQGIIIGDSEFFLSAKAKQIVINNSTSLNEKEAIFFNSPVVFCRRCGLASCILGDSSVDLKRWLNGDLHIPSRGTAPLPIRNLFDRYQSFVESPHPSTSQREQSIEYAQRSQLIESPVIRRIVSDEILRDLLEVSAFQFAKLSVVDQKQSENCGSNHIHIFGDVAMRYISLNVIKSQNHSVYEKITSRSSKSSSFFIFSTFSQSSSQSESVNSELLVVDTKEDLLFLTSFCVVKGCSASIGSSDHLTVHQLIDQLHRSNVRGWEIPTSSALAFGAAAKNADAELPLIQTFPVFVQTNNHIFPHNNNNMAGNDQVTKDKDMLFVDWLERHYGEQQYEKFRTQVKTNLQESTYSLSHIVEGGFLAYWDHIGDAFGLFNGEDADAAHTFWNNVKQHLSQYQS